MKKFFYGVSFLAICGLISKFIGAMFKVPLTSILGTEGIGIYLIVFPVYTVLLALSSGGLPQAISRQTASLNEYEARRVVNRCIIVFGTVGIIGCLLMIMLSSNIARLQGNEQASLAYVALSFSVFFVSIIAVFRGYFQGKSNFLPTALSQLVEQAGKLIIGIYLSISLLKYGLTAGVAGALLGVSISEGLALLLLAVMYIRSGRRKSGLRVLINTNSQKNLKVIVKTALPISLGSLILPLTALIDSTLIINLLKMTGYNTSQATQVYGIVMSPIATLINVPTVFATALAVSVIPLIAKNMASPQPQVKLSRQSCGQDVAEQLLSPANMSVCQQIIDPEHPALQATEQYGKSTNALTSNNPKSSAEPPSTAICPPHLKESIERKCQIVRERYIRQASVIGALATAGLIVVGRAVLAFLYPTMTEQEHALSSELLNISAINIFFISVVVITSGIMQGYGKSVRPAINLLIGGVVKIVATIVMVQLFGIYGMGISSVLSYASIFALNIIALKKVTGHWHAKDIFLPLLCGLVSLIIVLALQKFLPLPLSLSAVVGGGVVVALYWLLAEFMHIIDLRTILKTVSHSHDNL